MKIPAPLPEESRLSEASGKLDVLLSECVDGSDVNFEFELAVVASAARDLLDDLVALFREVFESAELELSVLEGMADEE